MAALLTLTEELADAILAQYGELEKLNLSCNGLKDIEHITRLASLNKLVLACNDLIDIRPLSALVELRELDISDNRVMDLSPLFSLTHLEVLNASNNMISSISHLQGLKELSHLTELKLTGNPICQTIGYPHCVFMLLPQIDQVDAVKRLAFESGQLEDTSPTNVMEFITKGAGTGVETRAGIGANADTTNATRSSLGEHESTFKTSKQGQLQGGREGLGVGGWMDEQVFASVDVDVDAGCVGTQTRNETRTSTTTTSSATSSASGSSSTPPGPLVLPSSHPNITSIATTPSTSGSISDVSRLEEQVRALQRALTIQEEVISPALNGAQGSALGAVRVGMGNKREDRDNGDGDEDVDAGAPQPFPYSVLLQRWREEVINTTADKFDAERQLDEEQKAITVERLEMRAGLAHQRAANEAFKQRLTVAQEQLVTERNKSEALNVQLEAERMGKKALEKAGQTNAQSYSALRTGLERCRVKIDAGVTSQQLVVMNALSKLESMEARLSADTQRIKLAAQVMAQKEVHLRNSAAILEGERRLWRDHKEATHSSAIDITASTTTRATTKSSLPQSLLEVLRPEVEAVLRAIFRQLDAHDRGYVVADLLVECLESEGMRVLLSRALGTTSFETLLSGVRASATTSPTSLSSGSVAVDSIKPSPTLTWGEFLVLLLPPMDTQNSPLLTERERIGAISAVPGLFSDEEWSLQPLSIPTSASMDGSNVEERIPSFGRMDMHSLRSELSRLSKERSYLLSKLTNAGRTMERRIQGVKSYFESDLSKAAYREDHLRAERDSALAADATLRARIAELEELYSAEKRESVTKIAALQSEVDGLKKGREDERDTTQERLSVLALDADTKNARLENELRVAKREMTKAEVKTKALQRDVVRLQQAYNDATEVLTAARNETAAIAGECGAAKAEKMALLVRVEELSAALDAAEEAAAAATAAAATPAIIPESESEVLASNATTTSTTVAHSNSASVPAPRTGGLSSASTAAPAVLPPGVLEHKLEKLTELANRLISMGADV